MPKELILDVSETSGVKIDEDDQTSKDKHARPISIVLMSRECFHEGYFLILIRATRYS